MGLGLGIHFPVEVVDNNLLSGLIQFLISVFSMFVRFKFDTLPSILILNGKNRSIS